MKARVSHRQALVLLFAALLSPLVRIVPGTAAETAGSAAWLTPLAALPVLLPVLWGIGGGLRRTEDGLAGLYLAAFGTGWGRFVCGLSAAALWLRFCGGLRFFGERFVSTMYPATELGMFFTLLLLVLFWMRGKPLAVWARAGQLFFYAAVVVELLVLLLSVGDVKLYNVLPVWGCDVLPVLRSTPPLLGTLATASALGFLAGEITLGSRRRAAAWCVGLTLLLSFTGFVVIGYFGAATTDELQVPFFSLAKEAGVPGAVERLESVVSCVWVFVDVLFLGLLAKAAARALCAALRCGEEARLTGPLLLAALPGGWLIASGDTGLELLFRRFLLPVQLVVLLALPLAASGVLAVRERGR